MRGYRKKLGDWGEELAQKYFEDRGYVLLQSKWRAKWQKSIGEIDLILVKQKEIIFVEVKTRTSLAFGYGEQAVNWSKKQKIKKSMNQFRALNPAYDDYFPRFDVLVVEIFGLTPKFVHYEHVELG